MAQDFEDAGTKESEMNEKDGPKSAIEDVKRWTRYLIGFAIVPIISFYLMEAFEHNALAEVRQEAQWFNILIFELIAWTLYLLIGRMTTALRIELAFAGISTNSYCSGISFAIVVVYASSILPFIVTSALRLVVVSLI